MPYESTNDDALRALCAAGDYAEAATQAIREHGPGVLGVLLALSPDEATAGDAYSLFCERVWQGLPSFRFESSVRTWAYVLGRRAMADVHRQRARGPKVVAAGSELPDVVAHARTETRSYLKTARKAEFRELRSTLSEDDQLLLVLRIDRSMSWGEIARVLDEDAADDAAALKRVSASLRKRFERARDKLRAAMAASRTDG